jgi:hypothetical protein
MDDLPSLPNIVVQPVHPTDGDDDDVQFVGTSPRFSTFPNGMNGMIGTGQGVVGGDSGYAVDNGDMMKDDGRHSHEVLPYPGESLPIQTTQSRKLHDGSISGVNQTQPQQVVILQNQMFDQTHHEKPAPAPQQSTTSPLTFSAGKKVDGDRNGVTDNAHDGPRVNGNGMRNGTTENALAGPSGYSNNIHNNNDPKSTLATHIINNSSAPIDLTTDEPTPPPPPPTYPTVSTTHTRTNDRPIPSPARQPLCIGSVDSMALILYPTAWMSKGTNVEELIRVGEVRRDQKGDEWLKVRLKFKRAKGTGEESINIHTCECAHSALSGW